MIKITSWEVHCCENVFCYSSGFVPKTLNLSRTVLDHIVCLKVTEPRDRFKVTASVRGIEGSVAFGDVFGEKFCSLVEVFGGRGFRQKPLDGSEEGS